MEVDAVVVSELLEQAVADMDGDLSAVRLPDRLGLPDVLELDDTDVDGVWLLHDVLDRDALGDCETLVVEHTVGVLDTEAV